MVATLQNLFDLIKKYRIYDNTAGNGDKIETTNLGLAYPTKGKFFIPPEEYEDFLKVVGDALFDKKNKADYIQYGPFTLNELHDTIAPVIVDFDITIDKDEWIKEIKRRKQMEMEKEYDDIPEFDDEQWEQMALEIKAYTLDHLIDICMAYYEVIRTHYSLSDDENRYKLPMMHTVFVLEKKKMEINAKTSFIKTGFHLIFPKVITPPMGQYYIRNKILEEAENLMKGIPYTNAVKDIIDKQIIHRNGWPIYGSTKKKDGQSYKVTYIINCKKVLENRMLLENNPDVEIEDTGIIVGKGKYKSQQLVSLLSIRRKDMKTTDYLNDKIKSEIEHWFNTFGNDNFIKKHDHLTDSIIVNNVKLNVEKIKFITEIVNNLNNFRAVEWKPWLWVGWCLWNIGQGDDRLFKLWCKFSARCKDKFKEDECRHLWYNDFIVNKERHTFNINTLLRWLKIDDPEKWLMVVHNNRIESFIHYPKELTEIDLADLIYSEIEYICSPEVASITPTKRNVYIFADGRWFLSPTAIHLYPIIFHENDIVTRFLITIEAEIGRKRKEEANKKIMNDVNKFHDRITGDITFNKMGKGGEETDGSWSVEKYTGKSKVKNDEEGNDMNANIYRYGQECISKIRAKYNTDMMREKIIKQLMIKLYNRWNPMNCIPFTARLNTNLDLILLQNGVYELNTGVFRYGKETDMLTLSAGFKYISTGERDPFILKEIDKFFGTVYPQAELKEFVLDLFALFMRGNDRYEKLFIWCGDGCNGKSRIFKLLGLLFGNLFMKTPIELILQKSTKGSGNEATPFKASLQGIRVNVMDEPPAGTTFDDGSIKQLTGNDAMAVRKNFGDPFTLIPQMYSNMLSNYKPDINAQDEGIWRRMCIIPHNVTFVFSEEDILNDLDVLADVSISNKIVNWIDTLGSMLCDRYYEKVQYGLVEPEIVKLANAEYRENNNYFDDFCGKYIVKGQKNDAIEIDEIHQAFAAWFKKNYERKMNRQLLYSYIRKRYRATFYVKTRTLFGYVFASDNKPAENSLLVSE